MAFESSGPGHGFDEQAARDIVAAAIGRYVAGRHARVERFVGRHFSARGALRLHRHALGWDVVKAPVNLALAVPQVGVRLTAAAAAALGANTVADRLASRDFLIKTRVAAEVEWLIATELLELPYCQGQRVAFRDALADEILVDQRVEAPLVAMLAAVARRGEDAAFREKLVTALSAYAGTRAAAADIATSIISVGIGAAALKQLTPGVMTLGPAIAATVAQQIAVASFPLGAGVGGIWYGIFPAAASPALVAGVTGGLMSAVAALAAFAGLATDPIQARLGLHQRRLHRLIDLLGNHLRRQEGGRLSVRDHYVARLIDLFDLVAGAYRLARA
ncbi:MAG TPA: DUF6635 family protein [Alphaproteobacteria bacterium]